jgi:hypothetical protein
MSPYRGSAVTALPDLNLGAKWDKEVNDMLRPTYLQ